MARLKVSKTQNPVSSIGERLRKAREDKGISLEEVHRATKIHPNVLEALEENRLEHVLGRAYVKAFLRNYAHYLGLDEAEIIREYTSKFIPEAGKGPILAKRPISGKKPKTSHIVIISFAFIIWLSILSFATIKFINHYKDIAKDKEVVAAKKVELEEKVAQRGIIPIPKDRTITLTVTTSKDVWLKVTRDNNLTFQGILPKNSKETWQANREIRLSEIGRPEALTLSVNGKSIDFSKKPLGKKVLITHEGIDLESKP